MLNFNQPVHRVISRRHTAPRPRGQLADFQGANDEHPAPVLHSCLICVRAASAKLVRDVRSESRGRGTENQPTGHGPMGWLEKGPSASLFVRYVSHRICSSLTPRIQTLLKPTVGLLLMIRCPRLF